MVEKKMLGGSKGEVNRLQGLQSEAIRDFTAALETLPPPSAKKRVWLLAHRGAAYGAMGALEQASKDLCSAIDEHEGSPVWALSQLGEAHRLYALANMDKLERWALWAHLVIAIALLDRAAELKESDPWILAHRGAAYANAYWAARYYPLRDGGEASKASEQIGAHLPSSQKGHVAVRVQDHLLALASGPQSAADPKPSDVIAGLAKADFTRACELSPGYAWVLGFHAYLLVLTGSHEQAMTMLGLAQAYDVNQRMSHSMLRHLAMLSSYQGKHAEAANAAWLALAKDPDDVAAAYFCAVSLKKQNDATADFAIERARRMIAASKTWLEYLEIGLDKLQNVKPTEEMHARMVNLLKQGHAESRGVFFCDPTWERDIPSDGLESYGGDPRAEIWKEVYGS